MQFVETHAHLNFPEFQDDLEEVIARALQAGVNLFVNPGINLETSRSAVELTRRYPPVFAAVGIHPHEANKEQGKVCQLEKLSRKKKVVAIGEIGLDYFRSPSSKEDQKALFETQLELALRAKKPIIVHVRDAYSDSLAILREKYLPKTKLKRPAVVHCFSGTVAHAQKFLKAGLMISFTGMLTYGNNQLEEVAKLIPLGRIMLETDSPFLAPGRLKGQRNEPTGVLEVAKKIAQLKGVPVDKVAAQTTANAKNFFNFYGA